MKYILDSCVALKWVLPESDSDKAEHLRDDFRDAIHELLAPDVFPIEVGNALTRGERKRVIETGQASLLYADIMRTSPRLHSSLPLINRSIEISSAARCNVYDCLYVALAEREGCQLLTSDARLLGVLQEQFPFIIPLTLLP